MSKYADFVSTKPLSMSMLEDAVKHLESLGDKPTACHPVAPEVYAHYQVTPNPYDCLCNMCKYRIERIGH